MGPRGRPRTRRLPDGAVWYRDFIGKGGWLNAETVRRSNASPDRAVAGPDTAAPAARGREQHGLHVERPRRVVPVAHEEPVAAARHRFPYDAGRRPERAARRGSA